MHGNRSPFAGAGIRGKIVGLTLEDPCETFIKVYWAAVTALFTARGSSSNA